MNPYDIGGCNFGYDTWSGGCGKKNESDDPNVILIEKNKKYRYKNPNEFKLTDHLSVRLEHDKTVIYVNDKPFNQCKYLLLTLDNRDAWHIQEEITSIDDAAKYLSRAHEGHKVNIHPETEFWGHCSNLQVWVENDYDLRVIHTNLGFPLLKKLAESDNIALISLKEELLERIEKTGFKAFKIHEDLIKKLFTKEEQELSIKIVKKYVLSEIKEYNFSYSHFKQYKRFIDEFFTKEEQELILEDIRATLISQIERQYTDFDIYSLLQKRNCVLCKNVFSETGHECTFCIRYSHFTIRDGIIIPKERYENFQMKNLSLETLLCLEGDLKMSNRITQIHGVLPRFAGGRDWDDDLTAQGDYIATITAVKREFELNYENSAPLLRILTSLRLKDGAQIGRHFYELAGVSEHELIMKMEEVEIWEVSNEIEEYVMYIFDQYGNGIKTGELTIS